MLPQFLLARNTLPRHLLTTARHLWSRVNRKRYLSAGDAFVWPTRIRLAEELGVTLRTLRRHLAELADGGWLRKAARKVDGWLRRGWELLNPGGAAEKADTEAVTRVRQSGHPCPLSEVPISITEPEQEPHLRASAREEEGRAGTTPAPQQSGVDRASAELTTCHAELRSRFGVRVAVVPGEAGRVRALVAWVCETEGIAEIEAWERVGAYWRAALEDAAGAPAEKQRQLVALRCDSCAWEPRRYRAVMTRHDLGAAQRKAEAEWVDPEIERSREMRERHAQYAADALPISEVMRMLGVAVPA